jgi:hypothetical protein
MYTPPKGLAYALGIAIPAVPPRQPVAAGVGRFDMTDRGGMRPPTTSVLTSLVARPMVGR